MGCAALLVAMVACRARDGSPEATAGSVWRAALSSDARAFRALYPTRAELGALFDAATAARMHAAIEAAAAKLPAKPPPVVITDLRVEKRADLPAGQGGLLRGVSAAKLRMKVSMRGVEGAEGDDTMLVVRLGDVWRALPKEAASLLP